MVGLGGLEPPTSPLSDGLLSSYVHSSVAMITLKTTSISRSGKPLRARSEIEFYRHLFRDDPAHIFEQDEEMHGICRRGDKIKMFVEAPDLFIFCMHGQRAYPRDLGRLQCALHRVPE